MLIEKLIRSAMYRREMRKLEVEMARCRRFQRQHLPVRFVLEEARWSRKSRAAQARKARPC